MSDLFERLFPTEPETENIAIHSFRAAIGDYATGNTSRAEIIAYWELDAEAQVDLNILCDAVDAKTALEKAAFLLELHDVMMIAEEGAKYTAKTEFRARLGL